MEKAQFLNTLKEIKKDSKKRKFNQTIDLIINFKDLDLKKDSIDLFINLPHQKGKEIKVCALVEDNLANKAKGIFNKIILKDDLPKLDKKQIKNLAKEYDFFVAQGSAMGQVATTLGRILGPLGKMPNPKVGAVITPETDLDSTIKKFKSLIRISTKNEKSIKCAIGKENMEEEQILNNITTIYDQILHSLPKQEHNIKSILLKLTMGKALKVGEKK